MRLFTRSLAAAVLTAGCYLCIPAVHVLAQSPLPGPSTSAPELSDQRLNAAAAALQRVASRHMDHHLQRCEATRGTAYLSTDIRPGDAGRARAPHAQVSPNASQEPPKHIPMQVLVRDNNIDQ